MVQHLRATCTFAPPPRPEEEDEEDEEREELREVERRMRAEIDKKM